MNCAWKELLALVPPEWRAQLNGYQDSLQEIRLRTGRPMALVCTNGIYKGKIAPNNEDLLFVMNSASRFSPWTASSMKQGYIATAGGHRVGLCGQAIMREGEMTGISPLRSVNIRVARDFPGLSRNLGLRKESLLILGAPGCGKTTLLRDLIRERSEASNVSVVDSRWELFPPGASFDEGQNTDILTGCGKNEGIQMVLRTMTPECIAVDEITSEEDCRALLHAGWCGVHLLATAHAASLQDFKARPIYAPLWRSGLFRHCVIMSRDKTWRLERIDPC